MSHCWSSKPVEGGETFFMNVMLRGIGEDDNGSEEVECLTVEEEER
jgi:hypothetical protein